MNKHGIASLVLAAIGFLLAAPVSAAVDAICARTFPIQLDSHTLYARYCGNVNIDLNNGFVDRAIVVVHGTNRNADDYMTYVEDAGIMASGRDQTTAIIAPQFLTDDDIAAHNLSADQLYWSSGGWKKGNTSNSNPFSRPFNVSSFAVVDRLIMRLADRNIFPNITEIVIAGHSAGGQFTHRYAAGGEAPEALAQSRPDLSFRYVVANPSSYLYFSPTRAEPGTLTTFSIPDSNDCPEYDDYKYGLLSKNSYMSAVGNSLLRQRYRSRRVITFLGEDDNDPDSSTMDKGCEAMLQGEHRLQRGEIFFNHIQHYFGPEILSHHSIAKAGGVGHSGRRMFQSNCGLALLYDYDPFDTGCTAASTDTEPETGVGTDPTVDSDGSMATEPDVITDPTVETDSGEVTVTSETKTRGKGRLKKDEPKGNGKRK